MLGRHEEGKGCEGITYRKRERRTSNDDYQGKTGGGECRKEGKDDTDWGGRVGGGRE